MERADKAARAARFLSHIESLWALASYVARGFSLPLALGGLGVIFDAEALLVWGVVGLAGLTWVVGMGAQMRADYLRRDRETKRHMELRDDITLLRIEFHEHMNEHHDAPDVIRRPGWPFGPDP